MESVNVFIGGPGCGGSSLWRTLTVFDNTEQEKHRRHFPPNRFLIDPWLSGAAVPSDPTIYGPSFVRLR